ncbi:hypothetical protein [Sphingomonas sp. Marseille-Q8236]
MLLLNQITDLRLDLARQHKIVDAATRRSLDDEIADLVGQDRSSDGTRSLTRWWRDGAERSAKSIGERIMLLGARLRNQSRDGTLQLGMVVLRAGLGQLDDKIRSAHWFTASTEA